jgi:AraC family transcriptional regulator, melibiose operon regulatory protein
VQQKPARKSASPDEANPTTPERRFYSRNKAFGRFGMRIFKPVSMERPHWHGHIELNFVRNARMTYIMDGQSVVVEPGRLLVFWAGIPHQLVSVEPMSNGDPELYNIYLPLDTFLFMPHIPDLQVALLNGGMVQFQADLCNEIQIKRWYVDYRSNSPERLDLVKMEINVMCRRVGLGPLPFLKSPLQHNKEKHELLSPHVRHVVAMVRYALENLHLPIKNSDVTAVTGLHTNYALALFSKTMQLPLKQFTIRMRLLKARGLLLESDAAISSIAFESGFGSVSQFYANFSAAYGISPLNLRSRHLQIGRG